MLRTDTCFNTTLKPASHYLKKYLKGTLSWKPTQQRAKSLESGLQLLGTPLKGDFLGPFWLFLEVAHSWLTNLTVFGVIFPAAGCFRAFCLVSSRLACVCILSCCFFKFNMPRQVFWEEVEGESDSGGGGGANMAGRRAELRKKEREEARSRGSHGVFAPTWEMESVFLLSCKCRPFQD